MFYVNFKFKKYITTIKIFKYIENQFYALYLK